MTDIKQYKDYWPQYLREHSRPLTRMSHYLQTTFGGIAILYAVWTFNLLMLLTTLAFIFVWALLTHILIEKNKPAAATHPFWWSVLNDIRMLFHYLTGTLKGELRKAGVLEDNN
ncbi:MAG: DUF962 domain-containing protein [Litorimonas sp.]